MNKEEFILEVEKLGIKLKQSQLEKLDTYYKLLIEWNKKINLTRIIEKEDVYLKHFYDSLTIIKTPKNLIDFNDNISLCDVGTGAGFPGMVLKIVFPNLKVTLLDSLNKRILFLKDVIEKLDLDNIVVVHDRAELYAKENREKFDIVTSRAVANLKILSELCIPMVKVNGYFIPLKANIEDEIKESKEIIKKLDSSIEKIEQFNLPKENSIRNIIIIKKNSVTNKKYPRNFDKIKKQSK